MIKQCKQCKEDFNARENRAKFCNRACYGAWRASLLGEKNPRQYLKIISCQHCGKEFKPREKVTKFCSKECKADSQREIKVVIRCDCCSAQYAMPKAEYLIKMRRGHKVNFCSNKCKHQWTRGQNHPRWIEDRAMVKSEDKSIRESVEMKEWRTAVFSRDNWTCQCCEATGVINAHHIKRLVDFPELMHDVENGITLCEPCHKLTYRREEDFEEMFMRMNEEKQADK